jgi:hypothetical protein
VEVGSVDKFNAIVNELNKFTTKHGMRFMSAVYDSDGNVRSVIISDNENDRDDLTGELCEWYLGFNALVANKFTEEELN